MSLAGKTILMSGGSRGIGLAIALRAAADGANIAMLAKTDTPHPKLEGTVHSAAEAIRAAGGQALPIVGDVRDDAQVTEAVLKTQGEFGGIDVVINNASVIDLSRSLDLSAKKYDLMQDVNVRGTHLMMQTFLPGMLAQGAGNFVNVASIGGTMRAVADRYAYGATKAAMIGLTKDIAADFVDQGIRANCICPGTILTPTMAQRIKYVSERDNRPEDDVLREYETRQAVGRMGRPDEIAGLAVFLASDESSFCTGASYVVDGGNSM